MQIGVVWLQMLWEILHHGNKKKKDDSYIIEDVNNHYFIEPPYNMDFIGKKMNREMFKTFLKKGSFDISGYLISGDALMNYVLSLDSEKHVLNSEDGEKAFVYTYPERIKNIVSATDKQDIGFYNQIQIVCERLKSNIHSNRAVMNLYVPGIDGHAVDIPCLNWVQALVHNDCLTLHVMFRSNDIYQAFPANMYFIMYLGVTIVDELREKYPTLYFGGIYYNSTSAHIYDTNVDEVSKLLEVELWYLKLWK